MRDVLVQQHLQEQHHAHCTVAWHNALTSSPHVAHQVCTNSCQLQPCKWCWIIMQTNQHPSFVKKYNGLFFGRRCVERQILRLKSAGYEDDPTAHCIHSPPGTAWVSQTRPCLSWCPGIRSPHHGQVASWHPSTTAGRQTAAFQVPCRCGRKDVRGSTMCDHQRALSYYTSLTSAAVLETSHNLSCCCLCRQGQGTGTSGMCPASSHLLLEAPQQ